MMWRFFFPALFLVLQVGGPLHPSGAEVDIDYPEKRHLRNKVGSDGAGLCVFTSVEMAADWANETSLLGFRDWMTRRPGGGYPEKLDRMIAEICRERGVAAPKYIQFTDGDINIVAEAVKNGHMVAVTYGLSPTGRYGGGIIYHMVNCVAARVGPEKLWAILDNNFPGTIEWMTERQFERAYNATGSPGWCVVLLRPGPPPVPKN